MGVVWVELNELGVHVIDKTAMWVIEEPTFKIVKQICKKSGYLGLFTPSGKGCGVDKWVKNEWSTWQCSFVRGIKGVKKPHSGTIAAN